MRMASTIMTNVRALAFRHSGHTASQDDARYVTASSIRKALSVPMFVVCVLALPVSVLAHAYGTGGVDQYIRILPKLDRVQVELDMHFAEMPSAAMSANIDTNADGHLSSDELYGFLEKVTPLYLDYLAMFYGEGDVYLDQMALKPGNRRVQSLAFDLVVPVEGIQKTCTIYCPLGEKGQPTIRIIWLFEAKWPTQCRPMQEPVVVRFRTSYVPLQCSRRIVYAEPESPLAILESDVPPERDYPRPPDITPVIKDKSQIPLVCRARLVLGPKVSEPASVVANPKALQNPPHEGARTPQQNVQQGTLLGVVTNPVNVAPSGQRAADSESSLSQGNAWLKEKIHSLLRPPLSPFTWPLAIVFSLVWGAMHALTPGHGKTIAGVYLAGAHASCRHALILGLATTLSHTAVVFVLAIVGYTMRGMFTYPTWLEGAGAAVILLVGFNQIRIGLLGLIGMGHSPEHGSDHGDADSHEEDPGHAHTHGFFFRHTHGPAAGGSGAPKGTLSSLMAIGVSGGMVPCPAAIVLLLLSWQLRVPGLGIACLLGFGVGLAVTLVGVGLLAVSGRNLLMQWLDRKISHGASRLVESWLPILGGVILIGMGTLLLSGVYGTRG